MQIQEDKFEVEQNEPNEPNEITETEKTEKKKKSKISSIIIDISILIVAAFSISCLLVIVVIPMVMGYESFIVSTDSMAPTLKKGDLIQIKSVSYEKLAPGQIVTMKSEDSTVILTHRISYIDVEKKLIYTKGDANETNDVYPVSYDRIVGVMQYKVPFVGKIVLLFRK